MQEITPERSIVPFNTEEAHGQIFSKARELDVSQPAAIGRKSSADAFCRFHGELSIFNDDDDPVPKIEALNPSRIQADLHLHNMVTIAAIREIIREELQNFDQIKEVCIVCTGSDGRGEKLDPSLSPVELEVIIETAQQLESDIFGKLQSLVAKHPNLLFHKIQMYCLETDNLILFKNALGEEVTKKPSAFPTRALDGFFISGDLETYRTFKGLLYDQIAAPANAQSFREFRKSNVIPTINLLKDISLGIREPQAAAASSNEQSEVLQEKSQAAGANSDEQTEVLQDKSQLPIEFDEKKLSTKGSSHINLESGTLVYNGSRIKSAKYPLLRPIQYKLADHITDLIRCEMLDKESFLNMPGSIIERIEWLAQKTLLNITQSDLMEIQTAYAASLMWTARSSQRFKYSQLTTIEVPVSDLQRVSTKVKEFCMSTEVFLGKTIDSKLKSKAKQASKKEKKVMIEPQSSQAAAASD